MSPPVRLFILRILLLFSAVVWGVSVVGVFLPWSKSIYLLQRFGLETEVAYDPMLDYWLRMIAGAFALLGLMFLALAWNPQKFRSAIPLFGCLMLGEGILLLIHGLRLHLSPFPFVGDVACCLLGGAGILWFRTAANVPVDPDDNSKVGANRSDR